jgi:hypothetical protein
MADDSPEAMKEVATNCAGRVGILDRHKKATTVVALLGILAAGGWLTYFYWPGPDLSPPIFAWYSVDNGATWFQDSAERIPPFEHEGKQAVRLHLYSCDDGKTTFVGYLQKLPEEVFKKYRDKGIDPAKVDDDELAADSGWLVKRPADTDWVSSKGGGQAYQAVTVVHSPNGQPGTPVEVFPKNPKKH